MKNWTQIYACGIALLSLCLLSCARPVLVVQASTADLDLEFDAYVQVHNDMEIAYDFWSPNGVPFISFLNSTDDTLLLNLDESRVTFGQNRGSVSLEESINAQTEFGSFNEVYPDLVFIRKNKRMLLVLEPQKWTSIYGPSCHSLRNIKRDEPVTFRYIYRQAEAQSEIKHSFNLSGLTRISRKEISSYERTEAGPDQYYIDKGNTSGINTTNLVLEIVLAILFAAI
ncbi:MAG: hypothetical protein AB8F78_09910 [Saprospiraceae bacterium]